MVRFSRPLRFKVKAYGYRPRGTEVSVQRITGTLFCSGWWYLWRPHWYAGTTETLTFETKAELRKWLRKNVLRRI